jgi:hypothetical protein
MKLQYHQKSLDLINTGPKTAELSPFLANQPPSVKEWFSLVNGVTLLAQYSNQDNPLPPTEFKTCKFEDKELVVFMYENQGVVWWAFESGDAGDPPVYINLDPPLDNWVLCCDQFSAFVYTRLFDFYHWNDQNNIVMGSGRPVDESIEASLRKDFSEEPVTHGWPGVRQIRFSQADIKITIHDDNQQSDWYFSADSPEALRVVFNRFKPLFEWYSPNEPVS